MVLRGNSESDFFTLVSNPAQTRAHIVKGLTFENKRRITNVEFIVVQRIVDKFAFKHRKSSHIHAQPYAI